MTNPLLIRSVNDLLYNYALSSAYRSAWVYDADFALAKDPDIWETIRRDPVIYSAIDRRNRAVIKPWRIEPPKNSKDERDKLAAAICEEIILNISLFDQHRYNLAQGAILGRVYEYIESALFTTSLAGTPELEWCLPTRLKNIDRRRFHWVAKHIERNPAGARQVTTPNAGRETVREVSLEMYNTITHRWEPVSQNFRRGLIEVIYNDTEDRVGYGRNLLEAIYFYHYFKTTTLQKIEQGIDRWANGILIGHIDGLRNASITKTNEDLRQGMKTLLRTMRSEHIAVFEKGDELSVVETSGAGHEISMNFIRYLDEGIERLLNGSIMPSGHSPEAGSKARAETESDTSEAFYQFDRNYLDEIITRDLIGFIWYHPQNRLNFARLGLEKAKMPRFVSEQEKKEDPLMAVQVGTQLLQNGVPLVRAELYKKTGFSVPDPGDEIIEGRSAPAPFAPFAPDKPFGNGNGDEKGKEKPGEEGKETEPVEQPEQTPMGG